MRVGSVAKIKTTGDYGIVVEMDGDYAKLRIHPLETGDACTLFPHDELLFMDGKSTDWIHRDDLEIIT